ncbi:DUF2634 domain-containing protein [Paenibacillus sp. J2TS4]|uniref:DUF2634 domain-containing protein n=1 Tax=Paenibacillus sp. J2TS4 TaxID=2807194 RepID=UPI001B0A0395|nr:DUF2634 domain-containing protein [Paenibacillus sp. J2TS4]GIP35512.1 hypothetical protein J2TS4_47220 [Paenibacillus sp. J2TS4]
MIPQGGSIREIREVKQRRQPSLTYRLDLKNKRISGRIDGLEAVKQAVYKILRTERYEHLIYTPNYGSELISLLGKDSGLFHSELKRRIQEALMQDDRVQEVTDFDVTYLGDSASVEFTVHSDFGSFRITEEVKSNV